jgi:hypothetical protein
MKLDDHRSVSEQQFPVNGNGDTAISGDRAVGRALARHLCRARARPTKHLSVHRELLVSESIILKKDKVDNSYQVLY